MGYMTEERKAEVERLSERESSAKMRFENLGLMNTYGRTVGERIAMDKAYVVARAEWYEAKQELDLSVGRNQVMQPMEARWMPTK